MLSFSALPLLLALSGCGGDNASNAALLPPCPRPVLLDDAADLTQFRPTGRDITDMVLNARITGLNGACKPGGRSQLATSVTVNFQANRGPAARGRTAGFTYFLAVMKGDQVLDKKIYPVQVEFPPNTESVDVSGKEVDLALPTPPGTSGAAYRLVVGFQLTPDELAYNRSRGAR